MKEGDRELLGRLKEGQLVKKTLSVISESPLRLLTIQESMLLASGINMVLVGLMGDLQAKGYLTMECVERLIEGEEL